MINYHECGAKCQECDWTCPYTGPCSECDWTCAYAGKSCSVPRDKHLCPECSTAAGPLVSDLVKAATEQVLRDNNMRLAGHLPDGMYSTYDEIEPEQFGRIPVRTELTVLPRDPDAPPIGWTVKEYLGPEVYLFTDHVVEEPITDRDVLKPGTKIAVPSLFGGYHVMEVKTAEWAETESGKLGAFLRFGEDDRQCWAMDCMVNTKVFETFKLK